MTNASIQGVICLVIFTNVLIMLKITGCIQIHWLYVFAPLWGPAIVLSTCAMVEAFLGRT